MPQIGARFFQNNWQEQVYCLLNVNLLPQIEDFFHHAKQILYYLCFSQAEQFHECVAITLEEIVGVVWLEFVQLPHHGDTVMSLDPVGVFYIGI